MVTDGRENSNDQNQAIREAQNVGQDAATGKDQASFAFIPRMGDGKRGICQGERVMDVCFSPANGCGLYMQGFYVG
jgi:hypothetical protein